MKEACFWMFTLFNKHNRNGDKIIAVKLKCRAAITHIDKKRGPPHVRRSSLADWLCSYASGSISSAGASAADSSTGASPV